MDLAVLSGYAASVAAPWLYRVTRGMTGWLLALLPLGLVVYFAGFVPALAAGEVFRLSYAWVPSLGISLSFYLDGLSLVFALLITGIGALIIIYSGAYLGKDALLGRFYAFILMFMASMLGVVLADNAITLFVFWELTSLSSFLLIGFEHEREEARQAAQQALVVTAGGGLAMLVGLLLLGSAGGSLELSALTAESEAIRSHALYVPILLLVLLGAFTKSAQFPFHFWLPAAMEAPSPVSAYLHSATMVKAGIYLLARLNPILGGTDAWRFALITIGLLTMLSGAYVALHHTDLKRILAYATVAALGSMVLLLGIGGVGAVEAAIVYLLAHAFYKGALFMIAGAISHGAGERDVDRLGGLMRVMPITAVITIMAAVSLAGLGPVLSFIGKELFFVALLEAPGLAFLLAPAGVLFGAILTALALIVTVRPFFGPPTAATAQAHEVSFGIWLGPAVLALLGIVIGVFPTTLAAGIVSPAVSAVLAEPHTITLALWHGINPALGLSALSLLGGLLLYRGWEVLRRRTSIVEAIFGRAPAQLYALTMDGLNRLAVVQTRILQNGYLRYYLLTVLSAVTLLAGYTLMRSGAFIWPAGGFDARFYELAIAGLILAAALAAVRAQSRMAAVAALGVVGYGIALVFILFGAPDLAMTQFMVESLVVVLLVLVFYLLPRFAKLSTRRDRARELVVAVAAGALMTSLVLAITSVQFEPPISSYFIEQSLPLAHGRNIVNVILVGFRALDTLGEITVLALAGVGVFGLLRLRMGKGGK